MRNIKNFKEYIIELFVDEFYKFNFYYKKYLYLLKKYNFKLISYDEYCKHFLKYSYLLLNKKINFKSLFNYNIILFVIFLKNNNINEIDLYKNYINKIDDLIKDDFIYLDKI